MFYFFVLQNVEGELYFGSTKDLKRRISEHNTIRSLATKNQYWNLVYYEAFYSETNAREREQHIKQYDQSKRWLLQRIKNSLKQY